MTGQDEVSTGELSRGLARVEDEMKAGFAQLRRELAAMTYVQPAVYAADQAATRDRLVRLEQAEQVAQQRAWQARLSLILAFISLAGALAVAALK